MLATAGLLTIAFSFCLAFLAFTGILGAKWLSIYALPAVYLAIGIGADDVLIAAAAFRAALPTQLPPPHHQEAGGEMPAPAAAPPVNRAMVARLSLMYTRAGGAMATTTFTTCSAFVAAFFMAPTGATRQVPPHRA